MARFTVEHETITYQDTDLKTLVFLGRVQAALSYARLRSSIYYINGGGKFNGLLAIYMNDPPKG
jgi:hypothetical protein